MTAAVDTAPWVEDLFGAIDAKDTRRFLEFLAPNATFTFGSAAAVQGHDEIEAAVDAFFASIDALKHELGQTVATGSTVICEGISTYTRHDGHVITLPFCNVFEMRDGAIDEYKIYIDIAPLFAEQ